MERPFEANYNPSSLSFALGFKVMKRSLSWLIAITCMSAASFAQAEVRLPKIFGDSMVLQQQSQVAVWGWADADEAVTVSLGDAKAEAKAGADGKWMTKLATPAAGGPFELKVKGKNEITLKDVLVGEVWICSGQSNMEWTVAISLNGRLETEEADYPKIRMIKVQNTASEKPQDDIKGQWQVCSPQTASGFSAVGLFYARHLHKILGGVPIGMINSSWGGTICEAWTSKEALQSVDSLKPLLERDATFKPGNPNQCSALYNGMIHPLVPFGIRGAIWYQGESNRARAAQYRTLFPTMIADWRQRFGQGDFPFYYVQLAPFNYGGSGIELAEIWEAQTQTLSVPNTGMCVTTDIGDLKDIHPVNKQEVGRRLALWALTKTYNKPVPFSGPMYESQAIEGDKIRLKFKHADGGLVARRNAEKKLTNFQIAGADKNYVDATAVIEGDSVLVSNEKVKEPVSVRFAWNQLAEPNFFNAAGLPAIPFRTDDYPLVTAGNVK